MWYLLKIVRSTIEWFFSVFKVQPIIKKEEKKLCIVVRNQFYTNN